MRSHSWPLLSVLQALARTLRHGICRKLITRRSSCPASDGNEHLREIEAQKIPHTVKHSSSQRSYLPGSLPSGPGCFKLCVPGLKDLFVSPQQSITRGDKANRAMQPHVVVLSDEVSDDARSILQRHWSPWPDSCCCGGPSSFSFRTSWQAYDFLPCRSLIGETKPPFDLAITWPSARQPPPLSSRKALRSSNPQPLVQWSRAAIRPLLRYRS